MIESPRPPFYRRPPVIERVVTFRAEVSEELFEERFEDWKTLIAEEFPISQPLTEWVILVEDREGIPMLNSAKPELHITPRFSRRHSSEGFDWSIRCPLGQLTVNMHSCPDQGVDRRYSHLRREVARWLPRWLECFRVTRISQMSLHYVNRLNRLTVPQFIDDSNRLMLERIVSVFSSIPGEHECVMPPYECTANVKLGGREDASMLIELRGSGDRSGPQVDLSLLASLGLSAEPAHPESLLGLLDWCHEQIVKRFEAVFTPEARKCFEPESP